MSRFRQRVCDLNDSFRKRGPGSGGWLVTAGVQSLGSAFIAQAIQAVAAFNVFSADNDPHGEHDFGSTLVTGQQLFWKIDYYDLELAFGSPDPSDPDITLRVLTIMLASEY